MSQNILTVQYEDLVKKPQAILAQVMQFLGLDKSFEFDISQIHVDECDRWRHYLRQYLQPLKDALAEEKLPDVKVIDEKAEEMKDLMGSAYLKFQQGDTTTTEILCMTLLEENNNHYSALHLLGLVHYLRDEPNIAASFLERRAALDP